ncbi:olfactory receptor-like protein OLF4 isoform X1 [Crotalus tigris]|uniref:olfactory receptor-like protein OLF4 isoform X1 n=2 Tax=Crotalus tigris TaxID=88082 RepID=UPI00192F71E0|nr:olfactory receptor-like protein OLF4 isoform X1 [Crotalus tigris]XP_039174362.1 olfactory receptor-like protein OLF4 isoform X1 [Crotalus tigris]
MENQTDSFVFLFLGLSGDPQLQIFLFLIFSIFFLITLLGNITIILIIRMDPSLSTPMYYFLTHLSFVDICYSTDIVPKMLTNFLMKQKTISFTGCISQMFFSFLLSVTDVFLLSAMAYDRYIAVCYPLHYIMIMNKVICTYLVTGAWLMGLLSATINTFPIFGLKFCGLREINHFRCELPSLLKVSCSDTFLNNEILLFSVLVFGLGSFLPTLISYIHIMTSIMKIHSAESRRKTFSTCSSHLTVLGLLYITGMSQYMKPSSVSSITLDELFSIQYSILTPMLNPIIYSLKNEEVKKALRRIFTKKQMLDYP